MAAHELVSTTFFTLFVLAQARKTFNVPWTAIWTILSSATIGNGLATCNTKSQPSTALKWIFSTEWIFDFKNWRCPSGLYSEVGLNQFESSLGEWDGQVQQRLHFGAIAQTSDSAFDSVALAEQLLDTVGTKITGCTSHQHNWKYEMTLKNIIKISTNAKLI